MKSINKNSLKEISLTTIVMGVLILIGKSVHADTFDQNAYKPIQLPEASRKQLPNVIRSKLAPEIQDIIERSPVTALSPTAKLGFEVKFEMKTNIGVDKFQVNCTPLSSGLSRCSDITILDGKLDQTIYQGVYAFGGLVPLYEAYIKNEVEFNADKLTNIKYSNNSQPALPSPGIDVVFDYDWLGTAKYYHIRCAKATENLAIPAELSNKGNVALIACAMRNPPRYDPDGEFFKSYNPGVFGGALYFWMEEQGIALPASLFYPNQLKGTGLAGYYNTWRYLRNGGSSVGVLIQNISFKWIQ